MNVVAALICFIIFLIILVGLLIYRLYMNNHECEFVGTIYISHEEDDVPLYFLSNLPIEELEKFQTGMIKIHCANKFGDDE